jgi:FACT complex subunit SPT16
VVGKYFVDEMSTILDEEKKVPHEKISNKIRDLIDKENGKWFVKNMPKDFDVNSIDWALGPMVQSGGSYDLKFMSESDNKNLYAGAIVAGLGCRYNTYNSFVARTYLVDPTKTQESQYKLLLSVHNSILRSIKDGVVASEVYNKALAQVKAKEPELANHFLKSVGYGIGLELQDKDLTISAKCSRTLKDGMTLVVITGFSDLENKKATDKRGKVYSLCIADTIRVTDGEPAVFTGKDAPTDWDNVSFIIEEPQEPTPKKAKRDPRIGAVAVSNMTSSRLRRERQANNDAEREAARREHQKELHDRKQKAGLEKYSTGTNGVNGVEEKKFKRFESYKRDDDIPTSVKNMGIVLDKKRQTILLPIIGRPVPFHINTIKNASTTAEGEYTSLRINFLSPGQGVGRKDDLPFEDPSAQFVRSLTYRSTDARRMEHFATDITDMKKDSVRREQEKKQMEDVVEQDKLVVDRRPQSLDMVLLRPALDTKRIAGSIQLHQNGVRYVHGSGGESAMKVDLLFNNVKHFFFQPCKNEMMVIIHFHLINPILIGKKKTKDVQFCRDATDAAFDETGNRKRKHRHGDEDEFEAEQEERRRRAELDKQFLNFSRKIEEAGVDDGLKLDMPLRDMSWHGVPSRSNVIISPTSDCLVQLTESPFLVVTLDDIEIVHLERVSVSSITYLRSSTLTCITVWIEKLRHGCYFQRL